MGLLSNLPSAQANYVTSRSRLKVTWLKSAGFFSAEKNCRTGPKSWKGRGISQKPRLCLDFRIYVVQFEACMSQFSEKNASSGAYCLIMTLICKQKHPYCELFFGKWGRIFKIIYIYHFGYQPICLATDICQEMIFNACCPLGIKLGLLGIKLAHPDFYPWKPASVLPTNLNLIRCFKQVAMMRHFTFWATDGMKQVCFRACLPPGKTNIAMENRHFE